MMPIFELCPHVTTFRFECLIPWGAGHKRRMNTSLRMKIFSGRGIGEEELPCAQYAFEHLFGDEMRIPL